VSVISKTWLVSDISITNLPTICYQERDWWVIHQSQTYLPFAIKNVTGEWYINHKPTYHLLSRTRLVSDISITNLPTICYQERDWWMIYQSQTYLPFAIKNMIGEWYINHKPIYHLLSKMWLVSDISITNLPAIFFKKIISG
jgi:outer membrane phospholipase A